jgi:hypothetical protein
LTERPNELWRLFTGRWPWIIRFAAALHVGWAIMLCISADPLDTTVGAAMASTVSGSRYGLVALLVSASACVVVARRVRWPWSMIWLLPQQGILIIAALGGLEVVWEGQYADGVVRPQLFILFDQLPIILLASFHSGAVANLWPWRAV